MPCTPMRSCLMIAVWLCAADKRRRESCLEASFCFKSKISPPPPPSPMSSPSQPDGVHFPAYKALLRPALLSLSLPSCVRLPNRFGCCAVGLRCRSWLLHATRVLGCFFHGNELGCAQVVSHVIAPPPPPLDIDVVSVPEDRGVRMTMSENYPNKRTAVRVSCNVSQRAFDVHSPVNSVSEEAFVACFASYGLVPYQTEIIFPNITCSLSLSLSR